MQVRRAQRQPHWRRLRRQRLQAVVSKQGACHAVRALLAADHGVLLVATIFSGFKPVRQRPAHRFAAALLMGGGWEVERLQDNALAIVDEAASGELICLRLAD